ncbi:hypothetical protein [Saccharopolyspora hattusasensis]|uniref:hypothetical protein n=1 Tax=Saccharopolyspora hattusasensis TaxID=1128679 RepID=UPI003D99E4AC
MTKSDDGLVEWDLKVDDELRRTEVHDRFGGSRQGGIASAPKAGSVLLFSSPQGAQYGYKYDGWREDGSYHYTGEGQAGDQRLVRGNKAVLAPGLALRLFEAAERRSYVKYIGEFTLDREEPYYRADAPDEEGVLRSAIVFRLWRADSVPPVPAASEPTEPQVQSIPVESNEAAEYSATSKDSSIVAKRREAALVNRYTEWLHKQGRAATRRSIRLPGQAGQLFTDLFDEGLRELIEAKGATSRSDVRLALGQVLDYGRYVKHDQLAILVPVRPAADLVDLLTSYGVSCIYEAKPGHFARVQAT